MDRLLSILKRVEGPQSVIPPTLLYNEGWMLRIVLDALADVPSASSASLPLRVPDDCRWYSEALLPSAFLARSRPDRLAESHTHADAAIGQFDIGRQSKGELALRAGATYFAVLEAKMFSALSSGVKNAPYFNQAARNVACVAEVLHRAGAKPEAMEYLAFHVVAPREQIESGCLRNPCRNHQSGIAYSGERKPTKERRIPGSRMRSSQRCSAFRFPLSPGRRSFRRSWGMRRIPPRYRHSSPSVCSTIAEKAAANKAIQPTGYSPPLRVGLYPAADCCR